MHDTIGNILAVIGAVACIILLIRGFKTLQGRSPSRPGDPVGAVPQGSYSETIESDIAVIATAVHAMLGRVCIVHIGGHRDTTWASEGRWMQQTSHASH